MKRPKKPKLPPAPTGFELIDLEWAELAPQAEAILEALPLAAHESWGTEEGMCAFLLALYEVVVAQEELARTRGLTLVRVRQRQLRNKNRALSESVGLITAALARWARQQHPTALPSQVLLLIRDRVKALLESALEGLPWSK